MISPRTSSTYRASDCVRATSSKTALFGSERSRRRKCARAFFVCVFYIEFFVLRVRGVVLVAALTTRHVMMEEPVADSLLL